MSRTAAVPVGTGAEPRRVRNLSNRCTARLKKFPFPPFSMRPAFFKEDPLSPMTTTQHTATNRLMSTTRLNTYCAPCFFMMVLLIFTDVANYLDTLSVHMVTYALSFSLAPILAGIVTIVSPTEFNARAAKVGAVVAAIVALLMGCLWIWLKAH